MLHHLAGVPNLTQSRDTASEILSTEAQIHRSRHGEPKSTASDSLARACHTKLIHPLFLSFFVSFLLFPTGTFAFAASLWGLKIAQMFINPPFLFHCQEVIA